MHFNYMKAVEFLEKSKSTMEERGEVYDSKDGERSMEKTINAFNNVTGKNLTTSHGWLIMLLLKQVRQESSENYHEDSALDSVAYSALLAESLSEGKY